MASSKRRHPNLNAILIVASGVFFGYAVATVSPAVLARTSGDMLASATVSITAAVPPNEFNTLAAQLHAKEVALNQREMRNSSGGLADRSASPTLDDRLGVISLGVSLVLLILVALNFYLDMRRDGRFPRLSSPFAVDLRRRS